MKKKVETERDCNDFERFDEFVSKIVKVPRDEILEREREEKERKKKEKAKRT